MAHHVAPIDMDSDFDNKENSYYDSNMLPCTEKGYEELDVSELNMKLRYSMTSTTSPMSKSCTANCVDNRNLDSGDNSFNVSDGECANLTRSLNSDVKNDNVLKSLKLLPLRSFLTDQDNRNTSVLTPLDSSIIPDNNVNITVTLSSPNDIDENLSLPSSSSSAIQTPEVITPTKEIPHIDGGSPIMRGIKSVLNMFRSSQSPIPPAEVEEIAKQEVLSPIDMVKPNISETILASTPIALHSKREISPTKRVSPYKESIVFNEDLEKELQWKDETTIIFSQEKIPIHKLFLEQPEVKHKNKLANEVQKEKSSLNSTLEYMDTLQNVSVLEENFDENNIEVTLVGESDSEFLDCETTFTKNESYIINGQEILVNAQAQDLIEDLNKNEYTSNLKNIVLNTTQDILDATLSITPEDLKTEALNNIIDSTRTLSLEDNALNMNNTELLEKNVDQLQIQANDHNLYQVYDTNTCQKLNIESENLNITTLMENKLEIDTKHPIINNKNIGDLDIAKEIECFHTDNKLIVSALYSEDLDHIQNVEDLESKLFKDHTSLLDTTIQIEKNSNYNKKMIAVPKENDKIEKIFLENHNDIKLADCINLKHTCNISIDSNNLDKGMEQQFSVDHYVTEEVIVAKNESDVMAVKNICKIANVNINDIVQDMEVLTYVENRFHESAADIPLPEDDIDELNIADDNVNTSMNTVSNPVPSNFIDDIQTKIDNNCHNKNLDCTTDVEDKIVHSEILRTNTSITEKPFEQCTKNTNQLNNFLQYQLESECSIISETVTTSVDLIKDDCIFQNNQITCSKAYNELQPTLETVDETVLKRKNEGNEDICEHKLLPDILDQAVTTCCLGNLTEVTESTGIIDSEVISIIKGNIENSPCNIVCLPVDNISEKSINIDIDKIGSTNVSIPNNTLKEISDETIIFSAANENLSILEDVHNSINMKENQHSTQNISSHLHQTASDLTLNVSGSEKIIKDANQVFDEKLEVSENTSPFVSVVDKSDDVEKIKDIFVPVARTVCTPPGSPPILSKAYKVNFDEIDPFATKIMIRMSPTPGSLNQCIEPQSEENEQKNTEQRVINRRKSQPEGRSPQVPKNKLNSTFHSITHITEVEKPIARQEDFISKNSNKLHEIKSEALILDREDKDVQDIIKMANKNIEMKLQQALKLEKEVEQQDINKKLNEARSVTDTLSVSSITETKTFPSELSTTHYHSNITSESIKSRNVFNIPEIDDMNFNISEKKSPLSSKETENRFAACTSNMTFPDIFSSDVNIKMGASEVTPLVDDKMEIEPMEKNSSSHIVNIINNATNDRDANIIDVNTEDEDTVEGPFLEVEDLQSRDQITDFNTKKDITQFDDQKIPKIQENTPTDLITFAQKESNSPVPGPSNINFKCNLDINTEETCDDLNVTISKPMMVVPPAVNSITPRNKSLTPTRSNRYSMTFTSPAMAVIDRLILLSTNNSPIHDNTLTQISREQNEADLALSQLRDLLAEKELEVYNLRSESKELKDRLLSLESQMRNLEVTNQDKLKKIDSLYNQLAKQTKLNKNMAAVVEEYEKTIATLIAESEQDKKRHAKERMKIINERDEQTSHLSSMEVSFNDLHSKYEKCKQMIFGFKANEDVYKKSIKDFEESIAKIQNNYELLKQHANSKLNHVNQELEKMNKVHETEMLKLNAMIKRKELHITSLEETLMQKTKANEELTAICDELINKVS